MMTSRDAYLALQAESSAWAIAPHRLDAMAARLSSGEPQAVARRSPTEARQGATAVIPIVGPLTRRSGFLSEFFGGSSYAGIGAGLAAALADRSVDRIALLVDSPGGSALGVQELAEQIRNANRIKPVIAVADVMAASAAFWLASQAGTFVAVPSGEIGSVGVIAVHVSMAGALDKAGIAPTVMVSEISPFKGEGSPFEPLGDAARDHIQAQLDELGSRFVADLALGRGVAEATVLGRFGKGRTLFAPQARRAGMIDRIATLGTALSSSPSRGERVGRAAGPATDGQLPPSARSARRRRLEILRRA